MKAAVYDRYGPPDVVHVTEVQTPVPRDNEVLVRIRATTICAADWRLRKADPFLVRFFNGFWKPKRRVLGTEFAGTIESAGKDVTRFHAGDEVFGSTGFTFGAHAEYFCLPETGAIDTKPRNMTHEEAAAGMFGATSALSFLRRAKIQAGRRVRGAIGEALRRARHRRLQHRQPRIGEVARRGCGGRLHARRFLESRPRVRRRVRYGRQERDLADDQIAQTRRSLRADRRFVS